MIYHIATVLLGPVFYVQGRHVRRVTPRLPEPAGDRFGRVGCGPQISLLIVGDSAAAGVGVESQCNALSGQLAGALSEAHTVSWKLIANSGDTSAQLLERLSQAPKGSFETVVVSIGVNDVTGFTTASRWTRNLEAVIETLGNRFEAQKIYFSSVPPMHYFPALPYPLRWWLGLRARQLNTLMRKVAENHSNCEFVFVPYTPALEYMAADGFHPGHRAYALWGRHLAGLIQGD
jgi:lysophospholipase L1-like esterase